MRRNLLTAAGVALALAVLLVGVAWAASTRRTRAGSWHGGLGYLPRQTGRGTERTLPPADLLISTRARNRVLAPL